MDGLEVIEPCQKLSGFGAPELVGFRDGLLVELLVVLQTWNLVGQSRTSLRRFAEGTQQLTRQVRFAGVLCSTVVSKVNAQSPWCFVDTTYCPAFSEGGLHVLMISKGVILRCMVPSCPRFLNSRNVSTSWASATTGALGAPSAMAIN